MRDALMLAIIAIVSVYGLRQAWIGAMAWTCISLASPHTEFAHGLGNYPVAMGVAATTLIGLLITREKQNPMIGAPMWLILAFTVWICITLPFSFFLDRSLPLWERSMKIFLLFFATVALIDNRKKLDVFIWVMVISIGYYGVKGGLFTIASGGNYRIWGPGGFIGGNNEVALALIVVIPFMRYLQLRVEHKALRWALTAAMGLSAVAALGTYSRGALLGVAAMGAFFWWRSKQKVLWGIVVVVIGVVALSLMPEQWWERMNTIKTYDDDISAMGRISAWWMAWNVAKAHFFGGGFMIYDLLISRQYSPDPEHARAAHSIYFQVLGEHGFVGFFIFIGIGAATWLQARSLVKEAQGVPGQEWAAELGRMVQVSMIGYGVTGAFLSLAYFDLPYNVAAVAVLGLKFLRKENARIAQETGIKTSMPAAAVPVQPRAAAVQPAISRPPYRPLP